MNSSVVSGFHLVRSHTFLPSQEQILPSIERKRKKKKEASVTTQEHFDQLAQSKG